MHMKSIVCSYMVFENKKICKLTKTTLLAGETYGTITFVARWRELTGSVVRTRHIKAEILYKSKKKAQINRIVSQ